MSTKKIENNGTVSKGLHMVLEFYKLAKEETLKCVSKDRSPNREVSVNTTLKCDRDALEKSASKVTKERDRNNDCKKNCSMSMVSNGNQWMLKQ